MGRPGERTTSASSSQQAIGLRWGDYNPVPAPPHNLDDWLCVPYAQTGLVQSLGEKTHAFVLDVDLGQQCEIRSIDLECLGNEVLAGLLGVCHIARCSR
jgi:hypothetical protein